MMKMFIALLVGLVMAVSFAWAGEVDPQPTVDFVGVLFALLGDKAVYVLLAIAVIGYIWAQLRQLIPADRLAVLPDWLVWFLELLAANKGRASNAIQNQPEHYKQWGG